MGEERIGVFICHCGTNIAGKVRVEEVRDYVASLKDVVLAKDYLFMCSDPGQELIESEIAAHELTRVVVASCSPRMHEITFRGATRRGGLNPFRAFQMICIREHCSWVTEDSGEATQKAKELVRGAVNRVRQHRSLETVEYGVNPNVLIVGGGIAGMQAALDIAKAGYKAYLVERQPTIGGHMLQFDKTFPTLDCASCIGTPKMVSVGQNPNIELMTYSEVAEVSGFVGNYKVKVRKKPRYVDIERCTGCGDCVTVALSEDHPPKESNGELWVDRIRIDEAKCIQCGECVSACLTENPELQGMNNIVKQRFSAVFSEESISEPTLLQRIMGMSEQERKVFWDEQFQKCIKCYGCVDMCPVYVNGSDDLTLSRWVKTGDVPPAYPLFHLLRGYNVWDTCVGCGECEKTCPAHIPLKTLQDLIVHLPPEKVFEMIPGLEKDAMDEILNLVERRGESSRRISYAV